MKTPHPGIKTLIEFVDDPSRYYSYMDERRKKQNARGWLLVLAIVWLIVRLAK